MASTTTSEKVDMALECGQFVGLVGGLPPLKTCSDAERSDARRQVETLLIADGWTPTSDEDEWIKGDRLASICVRSLTSEVIYGVSVFVKIGRRLLNRPLADWDFGADGSATLKKGAI